MAKRRWIRGAIKRRGILHRELGVPMGKTIPLPKLRTAAKLPGKIGRRARLALNLRRFR
jgi:hypothetical protein